MKNFFLNINRHGFSFCMVFLFCMGFSSAQVFLSVWVSLLHSFSFCMVFPSAWFSLGVCSLLHRLQNRFFTYLDTFPLNHQFSCILINWGWTKWHIDGQTDGWMDRLSDGWMDRQTDRQTDRHSLILRCKSSSKICLVQNLLKMWKMVKLRYFAVFLYYNAQYLPLN